MLVVCDCFLAICRVLIRVVKNSVLCVSFCISLAILGNLSRLLYLARTFAQLGLTPSVDASDLFVLKRR